MTLDRKPTAAQSLAELRRRGLGIGVVLDVGVLNATAALMQSCRDLRHLLFEPVEEHRAAIARNYRGIDHELFVVAVSDADGEATLAVSSVEPGVEITHSRLASATGAVTERIVPTVTLDAFLAARDEPGPYLLKIDVDGAEARILDGARATLRRTAVLMVEVTVPGFATLVPKILDLGFDIFDLVEFCYYDGRLAQFDAIFVRSDINRSPPVAIFANGPFDIERWRVYKA